VEVEVPDGFQLFKIQGLDTGKTLLAWERARAGRQIWVYQEGEWSTYLNDLPENAEVFTLIRKDHIDYLGGRVYWERGSPFAPMSGSFLAKVDSVKERTWQSSQDLSFLSVSFTEIAPRDTSDIIRDFTTDTVIAYGVTAKFRSDLVLTNYGQDTLQDFLLFSESRGGFNCGDNRTVRLIDKLSIPPGETFELVDSFFFFIYFLTQEQIRVDRCYTVAGVNSRLDDNFSDNQSCNLLLTQTAKLSSLNKLQLSVYPNPNDLGRVTIQANQSISWVQLFDLQGRAFKLNWQLQGNSASANISSLTSGLYLLRVRVDDRILVRQLIVQ
jgi:hypothetical protein